MDASFLGMIRPQPSGSVLNGVLSSILRLERSGWLPVFMTMVCAQGTVILAQFLAALVLSPSQIGVVRSLESALSLMVLIGSAGMQALSIRDIAEETDPVRRMAKLRSIYVLVVLGATTVAVATIVAREVLPSSVMLDLLLASCGLVALTNLLRATTGFAQGSGEVVRYYRSLMLLSSVALVVEVGFAGWLGVEGWILGRYLGEGLTLVGMLWLVHHFNPPIPWRAPLHLGELFRSLGHGAVVNLALVLRLLADTLPVLVLTAFRVPTDQIGVFGLASLALTSITLPLAVIAQRALPELVTALREPVRFRALTRRLKRQMLVTGFVGAGTVSVVGLAGQHLLGGDYERAFGFAAVLALLLPLKSLALSCGTQLMVLRRYAASVWANLIEVAAVAGVCVLLVPHRGAVGAAAAMCAGACVSALSLWIMVRRAVPRAKAEVAG